MSLQFKTVSNIKRTERSKSRKNYHFFIFLCAHQEANSCDGEIQQLRQHQTELSSQLESGQVSVQELQGESDTLDGDIDRLIEVKQKVCTYHSIIFWNILPQMKYRRVYGTHYMIGWLVSVTKFVLPQFVLKTKSGDV